MVILYKDISRTNLSDETKEILYRKGCLNEKDIMALDYEELLQSSDIPKAVIAQILGLRTKIRIELNGAPACEAANKPKGLELRLEEQEGHGLNRNQSRSNIPSQNPAPSLRADTTKKQLTAKFPQVNKVGDLNHLVKRAPSRSRKLENEDGSSAVARSEDDRADRIIPNFQNFDVARLPLSVRSKNGLLKAGFVLLGDVLRLSEQELAKMQNLGQKSVREITKLIYLVNNNEIALLPDYGDEKTLELRSNLESLITATNEKRYVGAPEAFVSQLMVNSLAAKELIVVQRRYGVASSAKQTLAQIGIELGVTRERIRQLQTGAVKKVRHAFSLIGSPIFLNEYRSEIENEIYRGVEFISQRRLAIQKPKLAPWLQLFIDAAYGSVISFLNEQYIAIDGYDGWARTEEARERLEEFSNPYADVAVSIKNALEVADWPIRLDWLQDFLKLPLSVLLDAFEAETVGAKCDLNTGLVKPKKLKTAQRLVYVLRREGKELTTDQIATNYKRMFRKAITTNLLTSTLGSMESALIVGRRSYNLYENMQLQGAELEIVRDFSVNYLMTKQAFISSKLICEEFLRKHSRIQGAHELNGYSVLGILQDDERFKCKRGMMVGLATCDFHGRYESLSDEIANLIRCQGPMAVKGIIDALSQTRSLIAPSVTSLLESSPEFMKIESTTYGLVNSISEEDERKKLEDRLFEDSLFN